MRYFFTCRFHLNNKNYDEIRFLEESYGDWIESHDLQLVVKAYYKLSRTVEDVDQGKYKCEQGNATS